MSYKLTTKKQRLKTGTKASRHRGTKLRDKLQRKPHK